MRGCPPILFLAIVITSLGFNAAKLVHSAPATARCPLPPDEGWTSQERFVWERVCVGEEADFNKEAAYGGNLDSRVASRNQRRIKSGDTEVAAPSGKRTSTRNHWSAKRALSRF